MRYLDRKIAAFQIAAVILFSGENRTGGRMKSSGIRLHMPFSPDKK
jgi:hypothetical protein